MKKTTIGTTGIELTELSFGTSSLGNISDADGYAVPEERAQQTLDRFFQGPANLLDTCAITGRGTAKRASGARCSGMGAGRKVFCFLPSLMSIPM